MHKRAHAHAHLCMARVTRVQDWWSRRESNPRPQAITGQFYMRS